MESGARRGLPASQLSLPHLIVYQLAIACCIPVWCSDNIRHLAFGNAVRGYLSLLVSILFGGIQLIGIGVLGEYIGRIYIEPARIPNIF